jgi:hypothetical protein
MSWGGVLREAGKETNLQSECLGALSAPELYREVGSGVRKGQI